MTPITIEGKETQLYQFGNTGNLQLPLRYKLEADLKLIGITSGLDNKMFSNILEVANKTLFNEQMKNEAKLKELTILLNYMKEFNELSLNYESMIELASCYVYLKEEFEGKTDEQIAKSSPDQFLQKRKRDLMTTNESTYFFFVNLAQTIPSISQSLPKKDFHIALAKNQANLEILKKSLATLTK